jgi:predicted nucleic acid-binding protein
LARLAYLDASAFVKLVLEEPESHALELAAERWPWTASALLEVEVAIAVQRRDPRRVDAARALLAGVTMLHIDPGVRAAASSFHGLRTLDAIHLATALSLGDHVDTLFTYDDRLIDAARAHGLTVSVPRP